MSRSSRQYHDDSNYEENYRTSRNSRSNQYARPSKYSDDEDDEDLARQEENLVLRKGRSSVTSTASRRLPPPRDSRPTRTSRDEQEDEEEDDRREFNSRRSRDEPPGRDYARQDRSRSVRTSNERFDDDCGDFNTIYGEERSEPEPRRSRSDNNSFRPRSIAKADASGLRRSHDRSSEAAEDRFEDRRSADTSTWAREGSRRFERDSEKENDGTRGRDWNAAKPQQQQQQQAHLREREVRESDLRDEPSRATTTGRGSQWQSQQAARASAELREGLAGRSSRPDRDMSEFEEHEDQDLDHGSHRTKEGSSSDSDGEDGRHGARKPINQLQLQSAGSFAEYSQSAERNGVTLARRSGRYDDDDEVEEIDLGASARSVIPYVMKAHARGTRSELVQCHVLRDRSSVHSKLYPTYELYLEESRKLLLVATKMNMNRTSNYHLFDMTRGQLGSKLTKKSGNYMGKLRARNSQRTEYSLVTHSSEREEIAAVMFERSGLINQLKEGSQPRKMTVVVPHLDSSKVPIPNRVRENGDGSMADLLRHSTMGNKVLSFSSKDPVYENGNYRLNFHGRVSVASVKNFQLVPSDNIDNIVCQFGKVAEDRFNLDFKSPLNALQAFSFALCQFNL